MYGTPCHNMGIGFFFMVTNFLTCGRLNLPGTLCEACQALLVLCSLLERGVALVLHADLVGGSAKNVTCNVRTHQG